MLRLISTADLAALAEMRTNAGAAARAILRSRGLVPGPNAKDDRREHERIAALLPGLDGKPRTGSPIAGFSGRKRPSAKPLIRQGKMGNSEFPLSAPVRDFAWGSAHQASSRRERRSGVPARPRIAPLEWARARVILLLGASCRTDHRRHRICARSSIPGWSA